MIHYNITISGKVQGVFYRQSALEVARQIGLKGFVRNEQNGNVYLEAEGTEEQLTAMVEWCKRGPKRANVSEVKVEEGETKNHYSFKILR